MTGPEKANALVEMGMVRLTRFDPLHRVICAEVAARHLDVATVEFNRSRDVVKVMRCVHRSTGGETHVCEAHQHGNVCYHALAALKMAAVVAGRELVFFKEPPEGKWVKVAVDGHESKAMFGVIG